MPDKPSEADAAPDPRIAILELVATGIERHREDIALCGGMAAFAICRAAACEADAAMTEDIDLVVERHSRLQKTPLQSRRSLAEGLENVGFSSEYMSLPIGGGEPAEKWVKEGESFYLEFLTQDHR